MKVGIYFNIGYALQLWMLLCFSEKRMGAPDIAEIDDVTFEKTEKGFAIKAATFPYLVRRSLHDFGK